MNAREFVRRMRAGEFPDEVCGCGCGKPLEPRIDGKRQVLDGKEVNDDCYFDKIGSHVEEHPIMRPR